jgi:hypothetical protein
LGVAVASIGRLQAYRAFGFPRLLLANEATDAAGLAWLAGPLAVFLGLAFFWVYHGGCHDGPFG